MNMTDEIHNGGVHGKIIGISVGSEGIRLSFWQTGQPRPEEILGTAMSSYLIDASSRYESMMFELAKTPMKNGTAVYAFGIGDERDDRFRIQELRLASQN